MVFDMYMILNVAFDNEFLAAENKNVLKVLIGYLEVAVGL